MDKKKCKICFNKKDIEKYFYKSKKGQVNRCKSCHDKYTNAWYEDHKKKIKDTIDTFGFTRRRAR